jgi:hypothetical protein
VRQIDEYPNDLFAVSCERSEAEPASRRELVLRALPAAFGLNPHRYDVLAALEPGQHIAVELSCVVAGKMQARLSFPADVSAAMARFMAGTLWPEADFAMGDAPAPDVSPKLSLSPLTPRPLSIYSSGEPVTLPHDPAVWPWQIDEAFKLLRSATGVIRISIAVPWSKGATMRRVDELMRQVQIAQLREPLSPLVDRRLQLIAVLRAEACPLELRVACSDNLSPAQRTLLSLLLFGEPPCDEGGIAGTLCSKHHLPATLIPLRLSHDTDEVRPSPVPQGTRFVLGQSRLGASIELQQSDRMRHLYVLGGTGTGKSTLMRALIMQDIYAGEGVILIDPHGDLAAEVLDALPDARRSDLIVADPATRTLGLPLLPRNQEPLAIERAVDALVSLFVETLYSHSKDAFGPIFEQYFRNAFTLIALAPPLERRLDNMARVFEDRAFRKGLLAQCPDPRCVSFWQNTAEQTGGDWSLANMTAYVTSKLTRLIGGDIARDIFSGEAPDLNLEEVLDQGKILLVPCAKGALGEGLSRLVTAAMLMRLRQAAMARADKATRRPVRVYLDEFQGAKGSELGLLLAEGRKYGLCLTLANQSIGQLGGVAPGSLGSAVLANSGNLALFRLGGPDAMILAPWLGGEVGWRELCRQPDFQFTARVLQGGRPEVHADLQSSPEESR